MSFPVFLVEDPCNRVINALRRALPCERTEPSGDFDETLGAVEFDQFNGTVQLTILVRLTGRVQGCASASDPTNGELLEDCATKLPVPVLTSRRVLQELFDHTGRSTKVRKPCSRQALDLRIVDLANRGYLEDVASEAPCTERVYVHARPAMANLQRSPERFTWERKAWGHVLGEHSFSKQPNV